jgi:hypothetical protein
MKAILAGLTLAALMAPPLLAQQQRAGQPSHAEAYPEQTKHLRIDGRKLDATARQSSRPTSNPDPMPCSTAPGFCAGYHGGNGG